MSIGGPHEVLPSHEGRFRCHGGQRPRLPAIITAEYPTGTKQVQPV